MLQTLGPNVGIVCIPGFLGLSRGFRIEGIFCGLLEKVTSLNEPQCTILLVTRTPEKVPLILGNPGIARNNERALEEAILSRTWEATTATICKRV